MNSPKFADLAKFFDDFLNEKIPREPVAGVTDALTKNAAAAPVTPTYVDFMTEEASSQLGDAAPPVAQRPANSLSKESKPEPEPRAPTTGAVANNYQVAGRYDVGLPGDEQEAPTYMEPSVAPDYARGHDQGADYDVGGASAEEPPAQQNLYEMPTPVAATDEASTATTQGKPPQLTKKQSDQTFQVNQTDEYISVMSRSGTGLSTKSRPIFKDIVYET